MAASISQQPNDYNLAVQPNVWTLSGLTTEDQYILNVVDKDANVIASIKQPANPAGVAHFDISNILQAQLGSYSFVEETPKVTETPGEVFQYLVQYGTVTNGLVDIDGASLAKFVYNGYDDWRNLNWNDTPFNMDPDPFLCPIGPSTPVTDFTTQASFEPSVSTFELYTASTSLNGETLDISIGDFITVTLAACGVYAQRTESVQITFIDGGIVELDVLDTAWSNQLNCLKTSTDPYTWYLQASIPIIPVSYLNADYNNIVYNFLTNYPNDSYPIKSSSYHTLSFINRAAGWRFFLGTDTVLQPAFVKIKFFDQYDNSIQTVLYSIDATNGLGPRTSYNSTTLPDYELSQLVGTVGVGPKNLMDAGYWPLVTPAIWNLISQTWGNAAVIWEAATMTAVISYYEVEIWSIDMCYAQTNGMPANSTATTLENYLGSLIYNKSFTVNDCLTKFDPVTVSFVNQYGVKDYYTFDCRNTLTQSIRRNDYYKGNPTWSESTFSINPNTGGTSVFSTQIETNMTLASNWMDDATSKWLEELFTSPVVQIYYEGQWNPAVVTNTSYSQKSYSRDKMFQHELQIKFANNKRVQKG